MVCCCILSLSKNKNSQTSKLALMASPERLQARGYAICRARGINWLHKELTLITYLPRSRSSKAKAAALSLARSGFTFP
jgi:hypothetical protein